MQAVKRARQIAEKVQQRSGGKFWDRLIYLMLRHASSDYTVNSVMHPLCD